VNAYCKSNSPSHPTCYIPLETLPRYTSYGAIYTSSFKKPQTHVEPSKVYCFLCEKGMKDVENIENTNDEGQREATLSRPQTLSNVEIRYNNISKRIQCVPKW